jgi:hypothetical protein
MRLVLLGLAALFSQSAFAYEYQLQFSATRFTGKFVAGYSITGGDVEGNCSYYITTSGSGRDPHSTTTYYYNTCTWDLYGNLLSMTAVPVMPTAPPVLSQSGTETIYGTGGASTTGADSRGFGFVNTPSAHYSWQTPSGGYVDIPTSEYTVAATLVSDGEYTLSVTSARVTAGISGSSTPSPGLALISANTCKGAVLSGATCTVTIKYYPGLIRCSTSGLAYTNIDLVLSTNSPDVENFTQSYTVSGVRICND